MILVPSGDHRGWMHPLVVGVEISPPQGVAPRRRISRRRLPPGRTVQSELCLSGLTRRAKRMLFPDGDQSPAELWSVPGGVIRRACGAGGFRRILVSRAGGALMGRRTRRTAGGMALPAGPCGGGSPSFVRGRESRCRRRHPQSCTLALDCAGVPPCRLSAPSVKARYVGERGAVAARPGVGNHCRISVRRSDGAAPPFVSPLPWLASSTDVEPRSMSRPARDHRGEVRHFRVKPSSAGSVRPLRPRHPLSHRTGNDLSRTRSIGGRNGRVGWDTSQPAIFSRSHRRGSFARGPSRHLEAPEVFRQPAPAPQRVGGLALLPRIPCCASSRRCSCRRHDLLSLGR